MPSESLLSPGGALLHYRLLEVIGEGGMGQVWKALDTRLERYVALKVLPADLAADCDRLGRLEREARLLASLNHPNVAVVYGLHEVGSVRFLASGRAVSIRRSRCAARESAQPGSALAVRPGRFGPGMYVSLRFEEAEAGARRSLELQPDYLLGLWVLAMALCGMNRPDEAVVSLERHVAFSRAPIFVGMLGLACARAARPDDAGRLRHELDDRRTRGEYVMPVAEVAIAAGLDDVAAVGCALEACIADTTPVQPVRTVLGPFLDRFRHDPHIDRMLERYYDGARPK